MTRPRVARLRSASRAAAALALAASAGCASTPAPSVARPPTAAELAQQEWPRELALAQASAARGEFAAADSVLRAFTSRYPGSSQSADALFWRALYRLDPAASREPARDGSRDPIREAAAALDAYLAGGPIQQHYTEAAALRRLAAQLDSLRVAPAVPRDVAPVPGLRDSMRLRDEENARLRQEVHEARSELERIRRRLAPRRRP